MAIIPPDLRPLQGELARRGYSFAPALSAADLLAFEQTHHIALPPDYRLFLEQVGNGGPGPPAYGLRPLGAAEAWWHAEQRIAW